MEIKTSTHGESDQTNAIRDLLERGAGALQIPETC